MSSIAGRKVDSFTTGFGVAKEQAPCHDAARLAFILMQPAHMESAAGQRLVAQGYLGKTNRLLRELGPFALGTRLLRRAAHTLVETGSVTFFVRELGHEEQPQPL